MIAFQIEPLLGILVTNKRFADILTRPNNKGTTHTCLCSVNQHFADNYDVAEVKGKSGTDCHLDT